MEAARRRAMLDEREREQLKGGGKSVKKGKVQEIEEREELKEVMLEVKKRKKNAFSAEMIKSIGFDPTVVAGGSVRGDETPEEKKKRVSFVFYIGLPHFRSNSFLFIE